VGDRARPAVLALLAGRLPDGSVCPSEVARAISSQHDWRDAMPSVHSAVDLVVSQGLVQLSWKGEPLARRDGPYRIRAADEKHNSPT